MDASRASNCVDLNRRDVVSVMANPFDVDGLIDGIGKAMARLEKTMRAEAAEKREAALIPLREENARLLIRLAALEAKVEGRPSEGTVVDMSRVLRKRRAA